MQILNSPLQLTYPLALIYPLVVLLIRFIIRTKKNTSAKIPDAFLVSELKPSLKVALRRPVLALLSFITLATLAFAASRPYQLASFTEDQLRKNLMLVLDVSESMSIRDFFLGSTRVNRLNAVQGVVNEFIEQRKEDKIGLVVFGSHSYLQAPLTLDHSLVKELIKSLRPGIAGNGTAIGDGLALGVKRIQKLNGKVKAIVLLTDGVNNSGKINPLQAAEIAKELEIKVHTIGMGSVGQGDFDEATLKKIADKTGGVYFNAHSLTELTKVYEQINLLQESKEKERQHEIRIEHFWKSALIAFVCYVIYIILSRTIFLLTP